MIWLKLFILSVGFLLFFQKTGHAVELAVTFDDLPASGPEHPTISRKQIAEELIATLKKYKVPGVYGFVNGIVAKNMDDRKAVLKMWKDAGFKLGNHTYSHKDLLNTSADAYIEDIEKNESTLIDFVSDIQELKILRFPYLQEGESKEKRYAVRSYLAKRNYRIAPVSVDFEDWAWGPAFIRCSSKNAEAEMRKLETSYLETALARYHYSLELVKKIYGDKRIVKHVLLLHATAMTAQMLDQLLAKLRKEGVAFITLDAALKDPVYNDDTSYWSPIGKTFFVQALESRSLQFNGLVPAIPKGELEKTCLD